MRKLTRLQTLFAGTAFVAAGVFGAPAAALAADPHPASTSDQVITDQVGSALNPLTDGTTKPDTGTVPGTTNPGATVPGATNPGATVPGTTNPGAPSTDAPATGAPSIAVPGITGPAVDAPSDQDLHPVPVTAQQQTFTPDHDQLANAKAIVDAAKDMNLPPRAWEIAVATSLQESNLHNLGDLGAKNDHDSLGLFQQRTGTGGWGTPDQIMDPHHAATAFLQRLVKVDGWDSMPLTKAAQKVQVSAYPQAYAKHEAEAGNIINALYGAGPYAGQATDLR